MRKEITVTAEPRQSRGKNEARRLRVRGLAPAVLYGSDRAAVAVSVNPKDVNKILHSNTGHNTIFNLSVQGGEDTPVMIVDWQSDPVKENLLHVDLKRIDLAKRNVFKVRVHTTGEPKGVKLQGGLLEVITREIEIECLPDDIPELYTIDVTELMIGQNLRASDIPLGGSVKLVSPAEQVIAHVVTLKAEVVETPAAEGAAPAAAAEPEVIKKGKKEEEGEAEPEKGKKK
jgi:large subunit ribosomal protein L25